MSWAPPNETAADLWLERVNFVAQNTLSMAYGAFLVFAGAALYLLLRSQPQGKHRSWLLAAYVFALVVFSSGYAIGQLMWAELMFIDARGYPGGPNGFFFGQFNDFVDIFSISADQINTFLADGMMLYRCLIIWNQNVWVLALPVLWFMASTALSITTLVQSTHPNAGLFTSSSFNIATAFYCVSLSFNIFVTCLIVGRLLWVKHTLVKQLGTRHTKIYSSISAMIVESAAIYSANSLIFIILYVTNNLVSSVFIGLLSQTRCIAPVLIIIRVAYGRGISRNTMATTMSQIEWGSAPQTNATAVSLAHANHSSRKVDGMQDPRLEPVGLDI